MATPSSFAEQLEGAQSPPAPVAVVELEVSDLRWRAFVASHPNALAFHRPAWAEMIADCYGYRPFVLAVVDGEGRVNAGVPVIEVRSLRRRRWVSLPFSDTCPPLLTPSVGDDVFASALAAARIAAGIEAFELRASVPLTPGAHPHGAAVIHTTSLSPDPNDVYARFHRSQVRRNIRRAEREAKLCIRRGANAHDLTRTFYGLHTQTRRRLGMPVQPRRFFEALWSHLLAPGDGSLLLAEADGCNAVAGAVFLTGTLTLTYKYGASDTRYWGMRPNHLLFWSALRGACEDRYEVFDWGRSDLADRGLREFKSGWGADEMSLVYTTLAPKAPESGSGRIMAAGRLALRHAPPIACRLAGELLYRRAA
jgi:CelD/BcsL family acetyltransferase involved in cellulose biosynthesis